jgi:hypothetical protein
MTISLYEGRRHDPSSFVRIMAVANVVFSALVLFAWPAMGPVLAEVVSLVTNDGIDVARTPEYLDYPYVLLWLAPLTSVVIAWGAQAIEMNALARFAVAYPLTLIAACYFWFFCGDLLTGLL